MKDYLIKFIAAKKAEVKKLQERSDASNDLAEVRSIGETLKALGQEIADAEAQLAEIDEPAEETPAEEEGRKMVVAGAKETRSTKSNKTEERANGLVKSGRMTMDNAEARAVLVSSGTLATPTEVDGIRDILGARVSSIVDMVKIVDGSGMGAYKVAYQKADAEAGTQTEGGEYQAGEPTFGFVEILPQTEAVISYISKQARKQTPLAYTAKVEESARVALRRKAAEIITAKQTASDLNTKITATALDEKTLRTIAFQYGGDESIVGAAVLQINKKDLVKLGDVRGSDKKPVYEITPDSANPNTGIIKDGGLSVPYVLNGNLAEGTLVYGQMHNFELVLFSNYEIKVSEDFAINKGMLTIVGDVELGGDVVVNGGFVVCTVSA